MSRIRSTVCGLRSANGLAEPSSTMIRPFRGVLFVVGLWSAAAELPAQVPGDSVDAYLKREMATRKIPGLAVAVIRENRVEKIAGYGLANVEFKVPVTPATLFQVASATKPFAGVAMMMLVEQGKLSVDDSIGRHLPDLPPSWRKVTVRQLLTHTSGLPDVIVSPNTGGLLARTLPEALRVLGSKPFDFEPGTNWRYNQTNYMLIAGLIERLSGRTFEQFCREKFFAPLGRTTPAFGDARAVLAGRATGYTTMRFDNDKFRIVDEIQTTYYEYEPFIYTAAGLNLSAEDLAAWIIAVGQEKFVTRTGLDELWRPLKMAKVDHPQVGLGWGLLDRPQHRAAGGVGGNRAAFFIYPDDRLAVVVLTNLQGADPVSLVEGVARLYFK